MLSQYFMSLKLKWITVIVCGMNVTLFTGDVTHNTGVTLRCASKRRFKHFSQETNGLQGDVAI